MAESNIKIVGGDGTNTATGRIDLQRASEEKPCYACKFWERDESRLVQHIKSAKHGYTINPDGSFHPTPRAGSTQSGSPMKLYLQGCGYCRQNGGITEYEATCGSFTQVSRREEMRQRLSLFDRIKTGKR